MSNELIRRLEVISEDVDIGEKVRIVEQYTQQLVNSDYDWKFCREIIVSGLKGWKRKEARKQKLSIPRFRSGQSSLKTRSDRKLMEKYDWFKKKYNIEDDNDNDDSKVKNEKKSLNWKHYKRRKQNAAALEKEDTDKKDAPPKAVLFVQYTNKGELASEIRKIILELKPWTNINIKVVERSGQKLEDILCIRTRTFVPFDLY